MFLLSEVSLYLEVFDDVALARERGEEVVHPQVHRVRQPPLRQPNKHTVFSVWVDSLIAPSPLVQQRTVFGVWVDCLIAPSPPI